MTDIKVGDTVRINKAYEIHAFRANKVGTEFEVKDVVASGISFYVTGDPDGRGVWDMFIEKVEPKVADHWRYNDHIVVYSETRDQHSPLKTNSTLGRGVTVLDETPLPKIYTRWENQSTGTGSDEISEAAKAYFDAHPEPKPAWHEAKPSEVWQIATASTGSNLYVVEGTGERFVHVERRLLALEVSAAEIVSARRIYPEQTA